MALEKPKKKKSTQNHDVGVGAKAKVAPKPSPTVKIPKNLDKKMAAVGKPRESDPLKAYAKTIAWIGRVGFKGVWDANYEARAKSLGQNKQEIMRAWNYLKKAGK